MPRKWLKMTGIQIVAPRTHKTTEDLNSNRKVVFSERKKLEKVTK